MTTIDYTETVLAELAHLVAQQGDPGLLNAAADFSSYFERHEVQRHGADIRATRTRTQGDGELSSRDLVSAVASLIARAAVVFVVKSSAIPELTTMYFPADDGVAEVDLVTGRTVVIPHTEPTSAGELLMRHLRGDPDMVLLRRQHRNGDQLHLAISGVRHALSEDGHAWHQGDEQDVSAALGRFVEFSSDGNAAPPRPLAPGWHG